MRFGYVMDVYLPKSKDNKAEHRGFGFVTFETEAAIQRVVSHGSHRLKGSTIAIDIAMPKVEDAEMNGLEGMGGAMGGGVSGGMGGGSMHGHMSGLSDPSAAAAAAAAAAGLRPQFAHHLPASLMVQRM